MKNYLVNPTKNQERVEDKVYERAQKIASKFEPTIDLPDEYCGNVNPVFDQKKKKFVFNAKDNLYSTSETQLNIYEVISSALLLYRTLCLFKCTVLSEGPEGYKLVWEVALKHKESGEVLILREWKGAATIATSFSSHKQIPESFKKDLLALLTELCAPDCPHPYDGTVSGSVA